MVKNNILLIAWCGLLACATTTSTVKTSYDNTCTKTENYGKIDAHEVINMQNKTTFEATEYIDCADGRNLVVITWEGVHDKANANLAAQIMTNFFNYFHAGENIQYLLVPEESGENLFVYKFENYEPQRTILSF
tara:strand:+ start:199 stop:600 length:402 start_codon:yes stop_codon:yes gene_type:complete